MGEAPIYQENVLCIMPFDKPTNVLDDIYDKYPLIKFKFIYQSFIPGLSWAMSQVDVSNEDYQKATILVTATTLPRNPNLVPNLKFIHFISAGIDHITNSPIYTNSDIKLTTSSGIHGPQIAEWVIMQLLAFNHHEKQLLAFQRQHHWGKADDVWNVRDYVGQRLGVLGYGSIGRQTASVCKALGMDIVAYTASPRTTSESKRDSSHIIPGTGDVDGTLPSAWYSGLDKASLHNFLEQNIDVLLVALPLTDRTWHFLGKEEFEILGKRNAFIVNIARGSIIVQDDLIAALKKKRGGLRGAALDVTDPEPLNHDSELWDMDNVAITPHNSGSGSSYAERSFRVLEKNLMNLELGMPLLNEVHRKRGY
ncbi:hypothetical protein OIDMADRAFT_60475 [Oidiodendron maius Zn]|uniref:D-isomer specific 2-hydroxyacid dehydrogenase NAD-binding domain-containing protein n=1 Tax=Oidiodendron maius (strain Zn) TaxID=913774 RepID=A0A0C3C732_OIDMZ|nr:hypothetical protein OIDMADRAFT_60475 [Oidiodendron maius Zn]